MVGRHGGSTRPFWGAVLCLLALGVASSAGWERTAETQTDGEAIGQAAGPADRTGGESDRRRVSPATEVTESAPYPQGVCLPVATAGGAASSVSEDGLRSVEPVRESIEHLRDRLAAESHLGAPAAPARGIAPHVEVCPSPGGGAAVEREVPLVARRPPATRPTTPPDDSTSDDHADEDTRQPPEDLTPLREADDGVAPAGHSRWPEPKGLLERLEELAAERATSRWAIETGRLVRELGPAVAGRSDKAVSIIRQLQELTSQVEPLADSINGRPLKVKLYRAGHALNRRLDVWEQTVQIGNSGAVPAEVPQPDPERLSSCLAEIDVLTAGSAEGRAWRRYLLFDVLREWSAGRRSPGDRLPRALAQRVLKRLTQTPMSLRQRRFVSQGPMAVLRTELRRWSAEPVDPSGLLEHLERYEQTGLSSDARRLATDCLDLSLLPAGKRGRLAEQLETYYRNANLRVVVAEELLDRLMPERRPEYAPVRDTVLGMPVRGQSLTSADVGVELLPDPRRARLALEISGEVASATSSTKGPATFYNDSLSVYMARKPLVVDLEGIHSWPSEVDVQSSTRLRRLRTDFDGIPLVGPLVHMVARSQHAQKRAEVGRDVRRKIALRARQQVDSEAGARLRQASERLRQQILGPVEAMGLDPTIIGAETTDRRLTIRLRLAGEDQLGSHTPRPRAPSSSLASLQVHQTAINNVLERLELDGRTFTLPELSRHVTTRLNCPPFWQIDPDHRDVTITFAKQDAAAVRLRDGRVELRLSIDELRKRPRRWRDFQVRVFYRPEANGRSAILVRDGIIRLAGRRMGTGSQITLRGIFARTFPNRRPWRLTPERLVDNPKLADLAVTQFVVEDGWVGLALGPQRTALRPARLR